MKDNAYFANAGKSALSGSMAPKAGKTVMPKAISTSVMKSPAFSVLSTKGTARKMDKGKVGI